jgi:serine/threonine protein kinase/tetratricopeptide (TPR) repeat protein
MEGARSIAAVSTPPESATVFAPEEGAGSLASTPASEGATVFAPVESSVHPTEAATMAGDTSAWSKAVESAGAAGLQAPIGVGSIVADRYEILKSLGEGGMGAVYKARDRELDRLVALKVIRPELARHAEILQRFKRELILARQVTHKNVIRIFDLGVTGNIKFITMEYVEGQDLKSLLGRQKFTVPQAVDIMCQVCRGLEAAHAENVIHRDLKPQNIMVDQQGKVLVMDFGLAHSVEERGMTQTGALMGTPDYMSPEQAKGEKADARSDLFTMGIIFYELLTGALPFQADSLLGMLLARTQNRAKPVREINPDVPPVVSDIVSKCLAVNAAERYQTASELLADLEGWQTGTGVQPIKVPKGPRFRTVAPSTTWKWIALSVASVAILLSPVAWWLLRSSGKPAAPALSLAIMPFRNASGDPSLDWVGSSIAEMLSTDVGQSASLRTVSSDRVYQILHDLRLAPDSTLDPPTLRRVAEFSNAQTLVWGQYAKFGDQIRIDATLQDLKQDRTTPLKSEAANANGIPGAVDRLAQSIRQNLSLSASAVKELQAQAFKPSTKSIDALRDYNEGLQLERQGKHLDAGKKFEASTKADSEFALAYAKLGQVYSAQGRESDADQAARKAVELSENLPAPEKYRIAAIHAWVVKDYPKAIQEYEKLAKVTPDDTEIQSALGELYRYTGAYDKAGQNYTKLLERDPKSLEAIYGMGAVQMGSGNLSGSLDYLNRALTLSVQLENDEKKALILYTVGIVYSSLGKPDEALRNYQESLAISRRLGDKVNIARTLGNMAKVLAGLGKSDDAVKNQQDALKLRREIGDKKGIGDSLIDLANLYHDRGQDDQAMAMYNESLQIQRDQGDERSQAVCLSNIGNVYFAKNDFQQALTYYQQSLQLREKLKVPSEIADTVHNLAETSLKLGRFDQALTQYLRALDLYRSANSKRDVALESHSTAAVFEYQGRYGAALSAEDDALKVFRGLQERGVWLGDVLGGYGHALSLVGRGMDAEKILEEALGVAREIKDEPLTARTLNYRGDRLFYSGDLKSAKAQYEQALRVASHTSDRDKVLTSKFNVAKVAVEEGHSRDAVKALKDLAQQAEAQGMKAYSVECSVYLAQALINAKDYSQAKEELQRSLDGSDKLGLRMLLARSHFLLGTALRLSGSGMEGASHYRQTVRLLDETRKEPGAEKLLERADLKAIYQESARWTQAAKN